MKHGHSSLPSTKHVLINELEPLFFSLGAWLEPTGSKRSRVKSQAEGQSSQGYMGYTVNSAKFGVCRGGVCDRDLWRRSCIGVCRGGVCGSDLCRRISFGVCRGVSVRVICVVAFVLVFAEEVSVRVICGAAVLLAFAVILWCQVRVSQKTVKKEWRARVSYKSVK